MNSQSDKDQPSSRKIRTKQWRAWCWKKLQSDSTFAEIVSFILTIAFLVALLMAIGVYLEPAPDTCRDFFWVCDFFGTEDKKEIMQLLGLVIAFIASMFGLWTANRRTRVMETSAKAQADAVRAQAQAAKAQARAAKAQARAAEARAAEAQAQAAKAAESGNVQQRFKDTIEHLGSTSESVRIGGAHTLFHIALEAETLRASIADILCTHIRSTTQSGEYQKKHQERPSVEIQSLMELLFAEHTHSDAYSREEQIRKFWMGLQADLSEGCFNGIVLNHAQFRDAYLLGAQFLGAYLHCAQFHSSTLAFAQFQMAYLPYACFRGAALLDTKFWDTDLSGAKFQASCIYGARFQEAKLESVQFQGGFCYNPELAREHFETRIRGRIGKNAELSKVIFAGGVNSEELNKVVAKLTHLKTIKTRGAEAMNSFKEKMGQHGGPPDNTVPEEIPDANVDAYTKADAQKWIKEYEDLRAIDPKA